MKIETVEIFVAHMSLFVRIRTDGGIEGIGESTMFAFPDAVASIIEAFSGVNAI